MKTLTKQGYRMPAEWERQQAVILSWPHNQETWPVQIPAVIDTYTKIILEIIDHQQVWLNVNSEQDKKNVFDHLKKNNACNENLKIFIVPTHDVWVRDYGPIYVVGDNQTKLITNWLFNGWGDKYDDGFLNDNQVPQQYAQFHHTEQHEIDFILEGGSIDVNGAGLLITSKNCLLNPNRNPDYSQKKIENILMDNLGVEKILWLDGEIQGDDTDGHIDDAVRFVKKDTVVCIFEENKNDENYFEIKNLYNQIKKCTDLKGDYLNVIKLPMPDPVYLNNKRLPASYANFLITNDKVLFPTYLCQNDLLASKILQDIFNDKRVVGIDCTDLLAGFGSIHCISQQVPA